MATKRHGQRASTKTHSNILYLFLLLLLPSSKYSFVLPFGSADRPVVPAEPTYRHEDRSTLRQNAGTTEGPAGGAGHRGLQQRGMHSSMPLSVRDRMASGGRRGGGGRGSERFRATQATCMRGSMSYRWSAGGVATLTPADCPQAGPRKKRRRIGGQRIQHSFSVRASGAALRTSS